MRSAPALASIGAIHRFHPPILAILDDYSPLRELKTELIETNQMFPIKKRLMLQTVAPMGVSDKGFQGANFYTAPNPDYGVTVTFYLKEEPKSKKSESEKRDRERNSDGKDVPYPN